MIPFAEGFICAFFIAIDVVVLLRRWRKRNDRVVDGRHLLKH